MNKSMHDQLKALGFKPMRAARKASKPSISVKVAPNTQSNMRINSVTVRFAW